MLGMSCGRPLVGPVAALMPALPGSVSLVDRSVSRSFAPHLVTVGIFSCVRHLPTCTTSGMSVPSGAFVSVNLPSGPVSALAIGWPV